VTFRNAPQLREHDESKRIDQDRVRQCEEAGRARAEHKRRHRDEGVGGVQVAAQQEPRHDGTEAPAAEAPLFEMREIAAPPVCRDKAENRDADEEQDKDKSGDGIH
jgi:hypothetical protein